MGPPDWLAEPLSWIGMRWPDGDPWRLTSMSDDWLKYAGELSEQVWVGENAAERVRGNNAGAAVEAFEDWWRRAGGPLGNLQNAELSAQEIGAALRAMATQVSIMRAVFVVELVALAAVLVVAAKAIAVGGTIAAAAQTGRVVAQKKAKSVLGRLVARGVGLVMLGGSIAWMLGCAKERLEQAPGQPVAWGGGASPAELALLASQRKMVDRIVTNGGLAERVERFRKDLASATSVQDAQRLIKAHGQGLWRAAVDRVQQGVDRSVGALTDDRPLYWARLDMAAAVRQWSSTLSLTAADRDKLIGELDNVSRGMTTDRFPSGMKRIFVTGFDPFELDYDPRTSNPSGAVAMGLDGKEITVDGTSYRIEAVVLPVRYADFDAGLAKGVFGPKIFGADPADMILTVSQGGSQFELEHFYSDRAGTGLDNAAQRRSGPIPGLALRGLLESTLPVNAMERAPTTYPIMIDNGPPPAGKGSGGDYLSNEVPRRVADLRDQHAPGMPTGHLHTPELPSLPRGSAITSAAMEQMRLNIINDVREIIRAGVRP